MIRTSPLIGGRFGSVAQLSAFPPSHSPLSSQLFTLSSQMASFRSAQRKPYSVCNICRLSHIYADEIAQRPATRGNVDGQWLHDKAPTGPAKGRAPATRGAAPPTGPAASINSKLVVSNLHYEVTPKDLTVRGFSEPFFSSTNFLSFVRRCLDR